MQCFGLSHLFVESKPPIVTVNRCLLADASESRGADGAPAVSELHGVPIHLQAGPDLDSGDEGAREVAGIRLDGFSTGMFTKPHRIMHVLGHFDASNICMYLHGFE